MKHILVEHENCENAYCPVCQGGLSVCKVCGTMEGGLTTDCAGVSLPAVLVELVYDGQLDYRGFRWQRPDGTGTSMGDLDINYPRAKTPAAP